MLREGNDVGNGTVHRVAAFEELTPPRIGQACRPRWAVAEMVKADGDAGLEIERC
jgi:hypothetical protein